jgi:hypothetical protein
MNKLLITIVAVSTLISGTTAFALTLDEAKANIDKQATEKKLDAKDHSQATATLRDLVEKGVPVDHASRVVEASMDQGMKGKDLAEVARFIEEAGGAKKEAAEIAAQAIQHKYTARETERMTNTFGKTVAAGVPADKTSQVMSGGINKGVGAGRIMAATNAYAGEIQSGTPPDKAAENALRTMDRERTMQHDPDRTRDRDHMGGDSGMDHGMDHGPGIGSGAGTGTGGSRR